MTPVMPRFNDISRRACAGSYSKIKISHAGKILCPFCFKTVRVNSNNTLRAHRK